MPPSTISTKNADQLIENIIDQLEGFGDEFNEVIQELRELQDRF
jgi:ABC-type transporter Mla subunit MlaD